ncbi:MAG: hypothetical protein R3E86_16780 [Pseudomonadales bacterium]
MSIQHRKSQLILAIIDELVATGREEFKPGDLTSRLRERNQPMGTWEVRGLLSQLAGEGAIEIDAASGRWRRTTDRSRKTG